MATLNQVQSIGAIFLTATAHFMSLCHIWVILILFQIFSFLLFLMVICDQVTFDITILIVLGVMNCTHRGQQTYLLHWLVIPPSLPLLGPSYSLRHNYIETGPISNPTTASEYSSERKSCMSLTLNHQLEKVKAREEVPSKAEIDQKLGLLHQLAKVWMQRKSSGRKLKVLLQWTHAWQESEIALPLIWRRFECSGWKINPVTTVP